MATAETQQQQQQQQQQSSSSSMSDSRIRAISSILNICERTTMNMERDGIGNVVKAIVIISMKFVDKEALFKEILGDMYIDWDYVRNQLSVPSASSGKKNFLGDASTWMNLVQFMDFGTLNLPGPVLQSRYPPLYCLHSAIQSSGAHHSGLNFGDACKMLLLNNIEGLASKIMMELHTSTRLNKNTHAICEGIISKLADERHGADVYAETFKYVIGTLMKVDEKMLAQHIAHYKQTKQARDKAWIMKAVQSKICRPSMRKVAASMQHVNGSSSASSLHFATDVGSSIYSDGASFITGNGAGSHIMMGPSGTTAVGNALMGSDGSGVSCITFEQHSQLVRYPNSMSNLRRLRCYLLACQGHHFNYQKYLEELVQKDVAKALAENPVPIPDPNSVYTGIDSLSMNILPFDELNQFRTKCFISFASHQKRGLSLTQVLKLYVAAYQVKSIWKHVWTSIYPVISPQIIRDVETFVATTPFAIQPFLQILRTSSPF